MQLHRIYRTVSSQKAPSISTSSRRGNLCVDGAVAKITGKEAWADELTASRADGRLVSCPPAGTRRVWMLANTVTAHGLW